MRIRLIQLLNIIKEGDCVKRNIKPITPRCGLCKKLYSYRDDDGSGLCLKCRPVNSHPILAVKRQFEQTIVMEVGKKMMDDFDQEQEAIKDSPEESREVEDISELQELDEQILNDCATEKLIVNEEKAQLNIEDIIETGRYGVSNSQMIPALKKAIAEQSIEKLALLKKTYFYTYEKSVRYLKKAEREYIANNLK